MAAQIRASIVAAFLCTIASMIICAVGLFAKSWWHDAADVNKEHGLFTVLNCTDNLCVLAKNGVSNEGFISFIQAAIVIQFIMLIVAIVLQIAGIVCYSQILIIAASGALGLSCASSFLQVCVLSPKYLKLSKAFMVTIERPDDYVVYTTLPLGLCALAGALCIPGFVSLVIYRTEERKLRLESFKK
ncbi:hypothetical protein ACF0H5_021466 [Mactra antiquata]